MEEIFDAFKKLKVLVIGDVMIDSYVWGKVERISPEAPVPIISVNSRENRMGGAANVARNIRSLGAEPLLCAAIGDDEDGKIFESLLNDEAMSNKGIIKSKRRLTTLKHRIISGSQHLLRIDAETDKPLHPQDRKELTKRILALMEEAHLVIFEDYDKGVISEKLIVDVVEAAKQRNIPVAVDPKKRNFMKYRGVDLFKPNFKELVEGTKKELTKEDLPGIEKAGKQLLTQLEIRNILLTLSEKGVIYQSMEKLHHVPAHIRRIADVSGAGDTVISIAGMALAVGLSPGQIAALSNLGGGLVCEEVGVVPIDRERLIAEAKKLNEFN